MSNLVQELRSFYFNLQNILKPDISVEVGAFQAEFSTEIKNNNKHIESYAFEANKNNFDHNVERVTSSGVNYINMAICDYAGELNFLIQEGLVDGGHLNKDPGNNSILTRTNKNIFYSEHSVECTSLDIFFKNQIDQNKSFCLWVDAEGASKQVLNGSNNILKNVQSIFIEVEHSTFWEDQWLFDDISAFMSKNKFIHVAHDREYMDSSGGYSQNNLIYLKSKLFDNIEIIKLLNSWYV